MRIGFVEPGIVKIFLTILRDCSIPFKRHKARGRVLAADGYKPKSMRAESSVCRTPERH